MLTSPVSPRALLVLDDSPTRVSMVLGLLRADRDYGPAAVHVVCSSARVAERATPALIRAGGNRMLKSERRSAGSDRALVTGPRYIHVLGGDQGRAARDADCCLRAANWLFDLVRHIHGQGFAIDAVAGPNGPLRATLLRGAIETAGTAADRLFLFRAKPAGALNMRTKKPARTGALLLIKHVPPSRRDYGRTGERYADVILRRSREWDVIAAPEPLVVDVVKGRARIGTTDVSLTPDQTFWYAAFASRPGRVFPHREFGSAFRLDEHGRPALVESPETAEGGAVPDWLCHLQRVFSSVQPHNQDRFGGLLRNACDLAAPQLGSTLAKIAGVLHAALGDAAEPYCVRARKGHGYCLNLPSQLVTVTLPVPRLTGGAS